MTRSEDFLKFISFFELSYNEWTLAIFISDVTIFQTFYQIFLGVQVLYGDIDEAICHHALYFAIWKKYGCLPERYNWKLNAPDVKFYPLRPEFIESTYLLYQATKNPFYLHVGKEILTSLNRKIIDFTTKIITKNL